MKHLLLTSVAALAFASSALPAVAFSTAHPIMTLTPLSAAGVAITGGSGCNVAAGIDGNPFFEMPTIAAEQGISGMARVKIDLTSSGRLAGEELFSSSGNRWLDGAALKSARMTRFTAEILNCERVAGSYLYDVEF